MEVKRQICTEDPGINQGSGGLFYVSKVRRLPSLRTFAIMAMDARLPRPSIFQTAKTFFTTAVQVP